MAIIRPRLNDYHNILLAQNDVDFAIPFLDEDIPLYVDPMLLWKSPSMQDNGLHASVISSFNNLGHSFVKGDEATAIKTLITLSESHEVGLGSSKTRNGKRIGEKSARDVLQLFNNIPQIKKHGFEHFEEIQLLVDNISKDRISDITCSVVKSFLVDYTIQHCERNAIPLGKCDLDIFDYKTQKIRKEDTYLPLNPVTNAPIILVPKRWLRYIPWISYDDYFSSYYIRDIEKEYSGSKNRIEILEFNRHNYDVVKGYTDIKEKTATACKNDPLFSQIPVLSAKRKLKTILGLPTGKTDKADKDYEDNMVQLLSSMLFPHLDFAKDQSRTDTGTQIRDLIFYNNRSVDFLSDIYNDFGSKQLVVELKNVASLEREHINQLNRYLADHLGKFGIIFTRNPPPRAIFQHTIDLWSGQRKCILILNDKDLEMMCGIYDSKQRLPIEVIKKAYVEFIRKCPA
jgi:hypothetical protein